MEPLIAFIKSTKLPSLFLILLMYYFGAHLIKGETEISYSGVAGSVILTVAITLTIFSFALYTKREETNNIIKGYETALKNISKTHTSYEKHQQETLSSQKIAGKYSLENQENTLDS